MISGSLHSWTGASRPVFRLLAALLVVALGATACNPYTEALPPARCRDVSDCTPGEACIGNTCERPGRVEGTIRMVARPLDVPLGDVSIAAYPAVDVSQVLSGEEVAPAAFVVHHAGEIEFPLRFGLDDLPLGSLVLLAVVHGPPLHEAHASPCVGESYGVARVRLDHVGGDFPVPRRDVILRYRGKLECP